MQTISSFSSYSVRDIGEAKRFYGEVLELTAAERPEGLELCTGQIFIYPKPDHSPATFTVLNFMVADIDTAVDEIVSKGVRMEHYDTEMLKTDKKGVCRNDGTMPGPKAIAWFKDPAGNILSLIQN